MNYCGIDLGKKSSYFHIVDGERKTVTAGKLANNVGAIQKAFAKHPAHENSGTYPAHLPRDCRDCPLQRHHGGAFSVMPRT
jgi:hypothetical protein